VSGLLFGKRALLMGCAPGSINPTFNQPKSMIVFDRGNHSDSRVVRIVFCLVDRNISLFGTGIYGAMARDELNSPLGVSPETSGTQTFRPSARMMLTAGVLALASGGAVWLSAGDTGHGGRATAVANIEIQKPEPPKITAVSAPVQKQVDGNPTGTIEAVHAPRSGSQDFEASSGVKVVRRGEGLAPDALIITIPDKLPRVGLVPSPDRRLIHKSRFGLLPVMGKDGSKAFEVYARPLVLPGKLRSSAPRLAIVIGGMGLSSAATRNAIKALPAAVSLAFAPYGENLQEQVSSARSAGHEVILQVPMEPFDLAGPGPGPHLLKSGYDRKQMKEELHWHMGRFTGYIGIANFLGAKFSAHAGALAPVIEEVRSRGLMYFDDGSSPRSLAGKIAGANETPFAQADVIIDENRDGRALDAALLKLEARAVQSGAAIGFASALPGVVARIARFANELEKRGVALVPVSSMISQQPQRTSNQ
jgi:uncharacterized protein